ncbi:MAG TPA: DUF1549 domain-containing protein [Gemmataceae bacterium]|nr:DUF1549 domain-containing protein [Gemmataceae bacterium]
MDASRRACFALTALLLAAGPLTAGDDAQTLADRIDRRLADRWAEANVKPADLADDAEFQRRITLDLIGRIPRVVEARSFQGETAPGRRRALIDRLLDSPGYAGCFARFWAERWLPQGDAQFDNLKPEFLDWLRTRLRENAPYDRMAREVLGTGGRTSRLFLQANEFKPENLAGAVSRDFLGVSLECAQCHDHPAGLWKREQFWQFAAFFAGGPEDKRSAALEITDPVTKRKTTPRFLDGAPPAREDVAGRRLLAEWMTDRRNPYFARAAVNAVWAHFFGASLVDSLDDLRDGAWSETMPHRGNAELLGDLGAAFADHDYDLKYLIRGVALTRAYQLTSAGPADALDPRLFARAAVRPLSGDQLFDSLLLATGLNEDALAAPAEYGKPVTPPRQAFLAFFARGEGAASRRTIPQALLMMNGRLTGEAVDLQEGRTLRAVAEAPFLTTADKVEALYLAALGRPPRPAERDRLVAYVESGRPRKDPDSALADVFWALLNSSEFGVNH